jgi:hypothetical protein
MAADLLESAESTAALMKDGFGKGLALCDIADAYGRIGIAPIRASELLTRAERFALAESDERRIRLLLTDVVPWAMIAPRQAERLVASLPPYFPLLDMTLRQAAVAMAPIDPRRAEQFASKIKAPVDHMWAMEALVEEFCESAPARAEHLALAMEPGPVRANLLLKVAAALHRRRSGE